MVGNIAMIAPGEVRHCCFSKVNTVTLVVRSLPPAEGRKLPKLEVARCGADLPLLGLGIVRI